MAEQSLTDAEARLGVVQQQADEALAALSREEVQASLSRRVSPITDHSSRRNGWPLSRLDEWTSPALWSMNGPGWRPAPRNSRSMCPKRFSPHCHNPALRSDERDSLRIHAVQKREAGSSLLCYICRCTLIQTGEGELEPAHHSPGPLPPPTPPTSCPCRCSRRRRS